MEARGPDETKNNWKQWLRANSVLVILVSAIAIGLGTTAYFSIKEQYIPTSKSIIVARAVSPNVDSSGQSVNSTDMDIVVLYEKNLLMPIENFMSHKTTPLNIFFYIPNKGPVFIKNIQLVSNSSNLLTVLDSAPKKNFIKTEVTSGKSSKEITGEVWNLTAEIGHPLEIKNSTAEYELYIFYRLSSDTATPIQKIVIPINWNINTLDFGKTSYFWIIFMGVMLSKVFSYSTTGKTLKIQLTPADLLWIPFSAIITLLIFASFKEQVKLTTDVITNLALAFAFGFGFDKIFESWQKRPNPSPSPPDSSIANRS